MAVLVVFGLVWVAVAALAALKVRAETRMASVEGFQRQLRSFGDGLPPLPEAPALAPPEEKIVPPRRRTEQRLRIVLAALLVAVAVSFVAALVVSTRATWGLHLLLVDCLLAYLALLVRRRDRRVSAGHLPARYWLRRRPPPGWRPPGAEDRHQQQSVA